MASSVQLSIFLFIFVSAAGVVAATDHIVGANRGWNPGINYTLWANNHTFYVGDLICMLFLSLEFPLCSVRSELPNQFPVIFLLRKAVKVGNFIY